MGTGPKLGDPHFEAWDEEDSMIMAWLWNSMILEISDTCMFLATAKDIWNAIQQTYSKARDAAQVHEVKVKNVAAKQGDKTVTEYANQLKSLWQELDHYKILGKQEVSCFNEVVALIRREESRRCLMLNPQNTDSSAMVAAVVTIQPQIWKEARHTRERCWKLHGKPPSREWGQKGEQPSNNAQAHVTTVQQNGATPQEIGILNQEEVERVRSLICNLDKPADTGSLAYSGKFPFSIGLNVSDITFANSWVIDSGATDHMTHSPNIFSTYFPCSSSRKIATVDGSLTTVAGIGDVKISPSLMLKNVLHVPRLTTNLISIQKLTQDLHCNVVFYHSHCVFQDEDSGRMIGHARERDGLYYLKAPISNKSSIPFYLIHSDIWGPSPIPNITGAKWGKLDPRALKCVFFGLFFNSERGENSVMEDKDRGDFLFLDLPSLPLSKQSRPIDPLIETLPKLPDQPEPVPENPKSAPENVRFDKVFSRKKTVVPESVQVQDFNPNSENEQSEIEESSLESMAKDIRTGRPDTPSEGGGTWAVCRVLLPEGVRIGEHATCPLGESGWSCSFLSTRMYHIRNSAPPTFHPDVSHPKFFSADIPPGCLTSEILLRQHSTRIFHIRHLPDAEWERRAFQLPRSDISGSADSAYPESFATIFCTVPRCSPEASRYLRPTF
ncbi:hypothetical protein CK203_046335 [Vitis vinifera]|uniref:Retrovirus-related Pol polyprotein from transposon TNT 1-94-like beta-barrel domain-containing protein n=1 Tax=Vitis vinifera TaxID=29760 RepID=A0A438FW54_VITVI|nr:hypothetical protein CK203_046335 [Vitis vinifera]